MEWVRVDSVGGVDSVREEDNPDSEGREEVCRATLAFLEAEDRRGEAVTNPELSCQ